MFCSFQCTNVCPPVEGGWDSNIRVEESGPRYTVITWDEDTLPGTVGYVVQYRQQNGPSTYSQSNEVCVMN